MTIEAAVCRPENIWRYRVVAWLARETTQGVCSMPETKFQEKGIFCVTDKIYCFLFFCSACCFAPLDDDDDDDDTGKPDVALEKRVGSPLRTRSARRSTTSSAAAGVRGWNVSLQEKHARGAPNICLFTQMCFHSCSNRSEKRVFWALIAGQHFVVCRTSKHKQRSRSAWAATF